MSETEPVKYFQGETKRLNYYNSQFLKEEDFRDEQLYHSQMRRFHNRSLHTWGVVAGLEVRPVAGARKVTVAPGMAIDRLGREIVLAREIVLPPESVPPPDAEADAAGFDAFDAGSTVYLTIKYREVFDPADKDTQSKNYRRTTERPQLALSAAAPAADAPEVVLAAVALDGDKAIARVGAEARRYAGSRFGSSADGKEFSIYADTAGAWHFFDAAKGADRLTFDGKGNVGIGTTKPLSQLHIRKDAAGKLGPVLTLVNGAGHTGAGAAIDFDGYDPSEHTGYDPLTGSPTARIQSVDDGNYSSALLFLSKAPGANVNKLEERMRISSAGNVGIGTSDPGVSKLKIAKSATDFAHLRFQGDDAGMGEFEIVGWRDGWNINTRTAGKNLYLNRDASSDILIGPSGKETIVKGDSGKVGIGTTSPAASLHVGSGAIQIGTGAEGSFTTLIDHSITHKYSNEVNPRYKIDRDLLGGGKAGIGFGFLNFSIEAGGAAVGIPATRNLAFYTSDANQLVERVRIDGSGNVGIGTTKPLSGLSIGSLKATANSAGQVIGELTFVGFNRNLPSASILAQSPGWDDVSDLIFKTSPSSAGAQERMRITSEGNVGIGTTSPDALLTIRGSAGAYLNVKGNNGDYQVLLGADSGGGIVSTMTSHDLQLRAGGNSTKMTVKADGNVGIGTSAPVALLDVNGRIMRKGQDFSSAGTVNHNGIIVAPWGKREDWNILVSPRFMGREEAGSEGDNAMLVVDCKADASPNTDNWWRVTARYKYRWGVGNNQTQWEDGSANYLIVPR